METALARACAGLPSAKEVEAWPCYQDGSAFMEDGGTYSASSDRSTDGTGFIGPSASVLGSRKRKLPQQSSLREKLQLRHSASSQLSDVSCMSAVGSAGTSAEDVAKLFLTAPKHIVCETLGAKPQNGLLCHEGLDGVEADPQEMEMGSPNDSSPGSDLSSTLGCELFQLQDSDADYPLLPGEAPSSTWPAVSHDVCRPQMPHVPDASLVAQLAVNYGFTKLVTRLGMSYLQRLAAQDSMLLSAALACHDFAPFMVSVKSCAPRTRSLVLSRLGYPSAKSWLICLQLACTYVAAKAVEFVPYKRLLQTMLTHVLGRAVPSDTATGMEIDVLNALDWRLGPFFLASSP